MVADKDLRVAAGTQTPQPEQRITEEPWPEANDQLKARLEKRLTILKQQVARRKVAEEALSKESSTLRLILEIAVVANQTSSIREAFQFTLDRICEYTGWPLGQVFFLSEEEEEVVDGQIRHLSDDEHFGFYNDTPQPSRSAAGFHWLPELMQKKKPVWITNNNRNQGKSLDRRLIESGVKAAIAFPILAQSDVVAAMEFFSLEGDEPDEGLLEVMANIGAQLARVVERGRSRQSLLRSQSLLAQSQQLAHLGSWEWDALRNQLNWSNELSRIFGVEPGAFDRSYETFLAWVHPEDRNFVHRAFQDVLRSKKSFTLYVRIARPDGEIRPLLGLGKPILNESGEVAKIIGTFQDLTEQKEAYAKLALQARRLEAVNKMGETVAATLDIEIIFERVLAALRPILGSEGIFIILLEGNELVFVATDGIDKDRIQGLRFPATSGVAGKVIKTGHSISLRGEEAQKVIFRKLEEITGERLQALLATPLRLHGEWLGVMEAIHSQEDAFDADDLQLLEAAASWVSIALQNAQLYAQVQSSRQRLGRLARKVVTAQEEERQRVSRELHDEAGQALIALKLNLESIRASLPPELEETIQQLTETIAWTDETMDEIRMIAHDLRPQVIESLGLNSALEGLCIDFARRTNLSIQYEGVDLPPLPDPVLISCYRFLQEALTNVAKHAGASQVHVVLGRSEESIYLSVTDDGTGFSVNAHRDPLAHSGLGLSGMQERFELLGGWVSIDSGPARGTRVAAYITLQPEWEEAKK